MARYIRDDEDVVVTDGGSNTASNFIWAIASIIIVGLLVWAIFFSGALNKLTAPVKHNIDINVSAPAVPANR